MKAIVLIAHGLLEHIMRYHLLADEFTKQGIAVYGPDHHAHGMQSSCEVYYRNFIIRVHTILIQESLMVNVG